MTDVKIIAKNVTCPACSSTKVHAIPGCYLSVEERYEKGSTAEIECLDCWECFYLVATPSQYDPDDEEE